MTQIPVALQMYTVRDDQARDFEGTFRTVAEIGYAGVELAGTGGRSAADLKRLLDGLGLKVAGTHVPIDAMEGDLSETIDYYQTLDCRFISCPWMPAERRKDADGWRRVADILTAAGQRLRAAGMQLCYHNHDFEFQRFDGQTGFDILFGAADPELVQIELDTYWALFAGEDPVALMRRYAGRIPLLHIKDMDPQDRSFAEVGTGTLPLDEIVAAAGEAGAQWYIVEQDVCKRPPLESARMSFTHMRAKGLA